MKKQEFDRRDFLKTAVVGGAAAAGPEGPPQKGLSAAEKDKQDKDTKAREAQLAKNKELNDNYQAGRTALEAKMYDEAIDALGAFGHHLGIATEDPLGRSQVV